MKTSKVVHIIVICFCTVLFNQFAQSQVAKAHPTDKAADKSSPSFFQSQVPKFAKAPLFVHTHNLPGAQKPAAKLPPEKGCFTLSKERKWKSNTCLTEAYVNAHYPHPEYLPAIEFGPAANAGKTPSMPITGGSITIGLDTLGSLTDTQFGKDAFSVQLNSNGFNGNNGHRDWVQFVVQHKPNSGGKASAPGKSEDLVCIWNVDMTEGAYHPTCFNPPAGREVRSNDHIVIQGYQDFQDKGHLKLSIQLSWVSGEESYGIVVDDQYGLTNAVNNVGNWEEVFGSILGYGNGSTANFSKTTLWVGLDAYNCDFDSDLACIKQDPGKWTWAATKPFVKMSAGTAEQNNLKPTVGNGPTTPTKDLPGLSCPGWIGCSIEYTNTAK